MSVKVNAAKLDGLELYPLAILIKMPDDHLFRFVFATPTMQVPDDFNDQLLERLRVKLHAGGEIIEEPDEWGLAPHSMAVGCTEAWRV